MTVESESFARKDGNKTGSGGIINLFGRPARTNVEQ
jgi:hypothetical protein